MPTFAVVNDLDFLHLIRCAMTSHCCFNFHFCSDYDIILSQKKVEVKSFSHVQIFVTPWTVAYNAPPSMGFSRQEYWCGLPFPPLEDLPDPGVEPMSPALQVDSFPSEPPGKP